MLSVVAGPDDSDPVSLPPLGRNYLAAARSTDRLSGLKVAYSADLGYVERIDSGVRTAFRDAIGRFADLGIVLKEDCPAVGNPIHDWNTLVAADSYASDGDLLASDRLGDDAREMIKAGLQVTGPAYAGARNKQMAFAAKWSHFMRDYDLMLTPTMECVAFPLGRVRPEFLGGKRLGDEYTEIACTPSDDSSMFCIAANMTGQPAITVPMGLAEDGLPVGLQIIGRRFEDDLVLRAAAAWERISPWPRPGAFSGAGRLTNG
jgi:Asp-tRNA(Asn)/Glu-tRNA(Gln) amidotransferase A subunit family amidase